jgi:hypothetical protein
MLPVNVGKLAGLGSCIYMLRPLVAGFPPRPLLAGLGSYIYASAVSRRLPTAAAPSRVSAAIYMLRPLVAGFPPRPLVLEAGSSGMCGGQSGSGAGFVRVLRFLLPLIPSNSPHSSSSIIRGQSNRPSSGPHTKGTQFHIGN